MLEYGEAYLESSRAAEEELRHILGEAVYEVALSMAPDYEPAGVAASQEGAAGA
jgi:hypothetical protein